MITSIELGEEITVFASTKKAQAPGKPQRCSISFPKLPAYFTGTGDLLSAVLLVSFLVGVSGV